MGFLLLFAHIKVTLGWLILPIKFNKQLYFKLLNTGYKLLNIVKNKIAALI
ncbi:hypothetical protein MuYL_0344 [Mucilaginibacter xinganensis]|uniref:Uncharacterized protein n=1 Tax=Mucilaginibacter xinganensis TaxID=1234841 RepID=A0A223NQY3_9SPHI|nr:hypothetical protein MuYL_0344 [Mucilaginibacter xinganensis]